MRRTVALVGTAPSFERVFERGGDRHVEIWSINRMVLNGALLPSQVDRLVDIHFPELATSQYSGLGLDHEAWLREEHPFPIYMHEVFPQYPASLEYPLDAVLAVCFTGLTQEGKPARLLTSSFSYLLGMAILERVDRIEIYGFEMASIGPYAHQREGALLLIGVARGMGIEVECTEDFNLYNAPIYGYEVVDMISRMTLEKDKHAYLNELEKAKAKLMHIEGQVFAKSKEVQHASENGNKPEELIAELQTLVQERSQAEITAQRSDALVQLVEKYLAICYSQDVPEEIIERLAVLN